MSRPHRVSIGDGSSYAVDQHSRWIEGVVGDTGNSGDRLGRRRLAAPRAGAGSR